jgi:uncharacterized protein (DUF427 family)
MPTATFRGTVIARSDETVMVEGNHYFPMSSVMDGVLEPTDRSTRCPWKGAASYYDVVVGGERAENAAWCYPQPEDAAGHIEGHVAFYPVVIVTN